MLSFLLLLSVHCTYADDEWNLLAEGPWRGREGLMGTFYKSYIWMSGGRWSPDSAQNISGSIFYNDVWKLNASCISDVQSCEWELVTSNAPWEGRAYHIMFNHSVDSVDYMYVVAGQNLSVFYNDVWRSTDGLKWEQVLANNQGQFHPRAGLAAISYAKENMIYLTSGCFDEFPNRQTLNDLWRSKDGSKWELIVEDKNESVMHTRSGPRIQILENELFVVAGEHGFSEITQLGDVWKLNLDDIDANDVSNNEWDLVLAEAPWVNRSGHGFVIDTHGVFWLVSGYYDLRDLWRSKDKGVSWEKVDDAVFNCKEYELRCGRYDFWAQLDDKNDLFLYGGDSQWATFGLTSNQTYERSLDSYK